MDGYDDDDDDDGYDGIDEDTFPRPETMAVRSSMAIAWENHNKTIIFINDDQDNQEGDGQNHNKA